MAFPYRKTLCAQLEVSMKTLEGYITELRKADCISSKKRQHSSAEYRISRPLEIQGSVKGSVQGSGVRFLNELKLSEGEKRKPPQREQHCMTAAELWPEQKRRNG